MKPLISLLIPFQSDDPQRIRVLDWLIRYWKCELPDAEIVFGHSSSSPFCKTEALNDAASRARGRVLTILDSDAYIKGRILQSCAEKIVEEIDYHLWYVPYRRLYRLTEEATEIILSSHPCSPIYPPNHPPFHFIDGEQHKSKYGHRYGAMIMMFPREALDTLGCFDERFKGWGGEDVALLRALDTLWGKHKTTRNPIFHMWHPTIGHNYRNRKWKGQKTSSPNSHLANKYHRATNHPSMMRKLVDEGCALIHPKKKWWEKILDFMFKIIFKIFE